jgi:hypothetical protein
VPSGAAPAGASALQPAGNRLAVGPLIIVRREKVHVACVCDWRDRDSQGGQDSESGKNRAHLGGSSGFRQRVG